MWLLRRVPRSAGHAAPPAAGIHATTPHIAAANEGLIVGRPVRNAVLRLICGMDLRLHPCSVAPAEGPEKCGPRRPTRSGYSCNNALARRRAGPIRTARRSSTATASRSGTGERGGVPRESDPGQHDRAGPRSRPTRPTTRATPDEHRLPRTPTGAAANPVSAHDPGPL